MVEDIEIDKLVSLRWRPLIDRSVSSMINEIEKADKSAEDINDDYVVNLSEAIDRRSSWALKSHAVWFICLILVYFSIGDEDFGFSLIWISSESVRECRGLLLMAFSFSMIIHSLTYLNLSYLKRLRTSLYFFVYEQEIIPFKKAIFEEYDLTEIFRKSSFEAPHWFQSAVLLLFAFIYVVILVVFAVFVVFMVVVVARDLHENPIADGVTQIFVLTLFYSGICAQICCMLVMMPLPGKDYSNLEILKNLEEENPEKYRDVLRNIFFHERRRYRRNCFLYGSIVYVSTLVYLSNNSTDFELDAIAYIAASLSLEIIFRVGQVVRKHTLALAVSGKTKVLRALASTGHILLVLVLPWGVAWLLLESFTR
ncbi:hypothetical protein [Thalassospira lucentensis]|uniref:hypothetical protein n=1 Tax=Thalassospira lucentensis TaxID=168935 RepID=UPI00399D70B0